MQGRWGRFRDWDSNQCLRVQGFVLKGFGVSKVHVARGTICSAWGGQDSGLRISGVELWEFTPEKWRIILLRIFSRLPVKFPGRCLQVSSPKNLGFRYVRLIQITVFGSHAPQTHNPKP